VLERCRAKRLLDHLTGSTLDPEGSVTIVVAMRADFYGRCAKHHALASLLTSDQILVGPMDEEELLGAVPSVRHLGLQLDVVGSREANTVPPPWFGRPPSDSDAIPSQPLPDVLDIRPFARRRRDTVRRRQKRPFAADHAVLERALDRLRPDVDDVTWTATWAAGRAMTLDEAVEEAFQVT
jgi:hypothetical protein